MGCLRFGNSRVFGISGKYGAVSFLQILAPELSDEMLADFLNTENGIVVNLHVQAIEQTEAIKRVKRKITDLDAMKIQEQKKAVRSGYDMDILPSDLATYGTDANGVDAVVHGPAALKELLRDERDEDGGAGRGKAPLDVDMVLPQGEGGH